MLACCGGLAAIAILSGSDSLFATDAVELFNGRDLSGWKLRHVASQSRWVVCTARLNSGNPKELQVLPGGNELVNIARSVDIYTDRKFGDCRIELEVMIAKGGNSGIYIMGNYEVQVFDSFDKTQVGKEDMGAIFGRTAPRVNASRAPGVWQRYIIDFHAPRFDAVGRKIANAKLVKCTLNGQVIHENVEIESGTGAALRNKETATGPLLLQGDHAPVAYRNIKITPTKEAVR